MTLGKSLTTFELFIKLSRSKQTHRQKLPSYAAEYIPIKTKPIFIFERDTSQINHC